MSTINKACKNKPSASTYLKAYDECAGMEVLLDMDTLPDWPELAVCDVLSNCPTIKALEAKDAKLQANVDVINKNIAETNQNAIGTNKKIKEIEAKDASQDGQINHIYKEISNMKGWNVKQDNKIDALATKVIRDKTYNNFQEWLANVYIPQCNLATNKYHRGDMYINVTTNVAATNATYINVRGEKDQSPCSAKDWQELYYSSPADVMTMIGIDPIQISHPFKHEWVISLNADKFERFVSELKDMDLTKVRTTLGEVYGNPVFQEDVSFKQNMTVDMKLTSTDIDVKDQLNVAGHTTLNTLEVKDKVLQPITFAENVKMQESLVVDNKVSMTDLSVAHEAKIEHATIQHLKVPGYANDLQWYLADIYSKLP